MGLMRLSHTFVETQKNDQKSKEDLKSRGENKQRFLIQKVRRMKPIEAYCRGFNSQSGFTIDTWNLQSKLFICFHNKVMLS